MSLSFEQMVKKLRIVDTYFEEMYPNLTNGTRYLARISKLTEEMGELAGEVLGELEFQRADKQAADQRSALQDEWADVFNSLLLIGIALDIDMEQAFLSKFEVVKQRFNLPEEA